MLHAAKQRSEVADFVKSADFRSECGIGVDPARVRGSGPSWKFASEGPPLFGPSQNVSEARLWNTVNTIFVNINEY